MADNNCRNTGNCGCFSGYDYCTNNDVCCCAKNTKKAKKTEIYKTKAQAIIDYNASVLQQAQNIESNEQAQDHKERHNKK